MSRTLVREHFQITLPLDARTQLGVSVGDPIEIYVNNSGEIAIRVLKAVDAAQAWFWTKEHQEAEREAEGQRRQKRGRKVKNARELIHELKK